MRQKVKELMGSYKNYILMNQRKERHDFLTAGGVLIGRETPARSREERRKTYDEREQDQ